jgi:mRNA-degrading endonuclease toxin of MazEF toxin-antitoxin module
MRGEVDLGKPRWLPKPSAVNIQGLASFDHHRLTRKLGTLTTEQFETVKTALREMLSL